MNGHTCLRCILGGSVCDCPGRDRAAYTRDKGSWEMNITIGEAADEIQKLRREEYKKLEIKYQCNCQICQYFRLFKKVMDEIESIGEINAEFFDEPVTNIYNLCDDTLGLFRTEHEKEIAEEND